MNGRWILTDFRLNIKAWLRSKGTVFWTLLFPVLLIVIFGAIFSGADDVEYDLIIQDLDNSDISQNLTTYLKQIDVLKITEIKNDTDVKEYMKNNDIYSALVIPEGFNETIIKYQISKQNAAVPYNGSLPFNLTFIMDPSQASTTSIVGSIISSFLYEYNMRLTNGEKVIGINEESSLGEDFNFIDFFIPGMIGFTIMTSCIYGSIERNTKFRKDGILRKLKTMPISRFEWIFAKMLFMLFLSFISTSVILLVGIGVWGLHIHFNIFMFILIIANSFLFSGLGMLISRFVKEQETADMAGGAITFPMMFLAGTFFPVDQMGPILQGIAKVLPLYYVNEGLRNAMIYQNFDKTIYFTAFVLVFAFVFFMIGALVTKWKED